MPPGFKPIVIADIMDMLLVGTLVYGIMLWFKRTKAAFVALGLLLAVVVYAVALVAGMYMTVRLFPGLLRGLYRRGDHHLPGGDPLYV